jgi:hypothetical protein
MGRACSTSGVKRKACRILVGKTPLGRHRRRWEDNINMHLRVIKWGRTGLIWLRIGTSEEGGPVKTVMKL